MRTFGELFLICGAVVAQNAPVGSAPNPAPKLEFEVASVKQVDPRAANSVSDGGTTHGFNGGPGTSDPQRIFYYDLSLKRLLMRAYGVASDQVIGPEWLNTVSFDIVASVPAGSTAEQVKVMLQNLLAVRFGLTLHHETRELPMYEVTVAKSGLALKTSQFPDAKPGTIPPKSLALDKHGFPILPAGVALETRISSERDGTIRAAYRSYPMARLVQEVADILGEPAPSEPGGAVIPARVSDKTGLPGKYDFTLEYAGRGLSGSGPKISGALEKQLGLKLTKSKGKLDVIIVDHANRMPADD